MSEKQKSNSSENNSCRRSARKREEHVPSLVMAPMRVLQERSARRWEDIVMILITSTKV
tara:strand:- start:209 stop:385 length:177 start_codon:yes stop_codon:yes gene_type:complete